MAELAVPERIVLPDSTLRSGERPFVLYIPQDVIEDRTNVLAEQILSDYDGKPIHLIDVAMGGVFWATDLARAICRNDPHVRMTHDLIRLGSYGASTNSSGVIRVMSDLGRPELIENNNVIIVDEVVDSGLSIAHMRRTIEQGVPIGRAPDARRVRPATLAIAALTDKPSAHNGTGSLSTSLALNYVGFAVPNEWLVGMGMDHEELGRQLPAIYRSATPDDPREVPAYVMPATVSPFALAA